MDLFQIHTLKSIPSSLRRNIIKHHNNKVILILNLIDQYEKIDRSEITPYDLGNMIRNFLTNENKILMEKLRLEYLENNNMFSKYRNKDLFISKEDFIITILKSYNNVFNLKEYQFPKCGDDEYVQFALEIYMCIYH